MQHGDAAVELGLHIAIAGGREAHRTELFVLLGDCAACECRGDHAGGKQDSSRLLVHRKSPLCLRERWSVSLRHDRILGARFPAKESRCRHARRLKAVLARCSPRRERDTVSNGNYQYGRWPVHCTLLHNRTLVELENCGRSKGQRHCPFRAAAIASSRSRSITWSALANSVFPQPGGHCNAKRILEIVRRIPTRRLLLSVLCHNRTHAAHAKRARQARAIYQRRRRRCSSELPGSFRAATLSAP